MEENVVFSTNIATIAQTGNNKRLFNRKMVIRTIKVHPYYEVVLSNKKEATIDIHSTFLSLQRITLGGRGGEANSKRYLLYDSMYKTFLGPKN